MAGGSLGALNLLAYAHAGSLTRYALEGEATPALEELDWLERASVLLTGPRLPRPRNEQDPGDFGLAYRTQELRAGAVELSAWIVRRDDSRGVVVLVHGFAGSKDALLPHARELHDLGWSSLLLDLRGSGGSSGSNTSLGWHEAEDVRAAVLAAEELALGPVVVYGQSMGAAAALRAIHLDWSRPAALVLEAPFGRLRDAVRNRFDLLGVPSFPCAELLVFWGGARAGIDGFAHDPLDYARAVRCPTLVLAGALDRRATPDQVRELSQALGEGGRLESFPRAGHVATLDSDRRRWRRAIAGLLREVEQR